MVQKTGGLKSFGRPFEAAPLAIFSSCTTHPAHRVRLASLEGTDRTRKSNFRGVQVGLKGLWRATIQDSQLGYPGKAHLGAFADERLAALLYDFALLLLGNEPVNFPVEHYRGLPQEDRDYALGIVAARLATTGWRPKRPGPFHTSPS